MLLIESLVSVINRNDAAGKSHRATSPRTLSLE
jgi:hypothetical protein